MVFTALLGQLYYFQEKSLITNTKKEVANNKELIAWRILPVPARCPTISINLS